MTVIKVAFPFLFLINICFCLDRIQDEPDDAKELSLVEQYADMEREGAQKPEISRAMQYHLAKSGISRLKFCLQTTAEFDAYPSQQDIEKSRQALSILCESVLVKKIPPKKGSAFQEANLLRQSVKTADTLARLKGNDRIRAGKKLHGMIDQDVLTNHLIERERTKGPMPYVAKKSKPSAPAVTEQDIKDYDQYGPFPYIRGSNKENIIEKNALIQKIQRSRERYQNAVVSSGQK